MGSWREVFVIFIMVGGCLVAAWLNKENLAMVLAGAAAGYATRQQGTLNGAKTEHLPNDLAKGQKA